MYMYLLTLDQLKLLDPPLGGNSVSEEKGDGNSTGTNEEEPKKMKEDGDGTYTSWAILALRVNAEL